MEKCIRPQYYCVVALLSKKQPHLLEINEKEPKSNKGIFIEVKQNSPNYKMKAGGWKRGAMV
jgi:hypothetical protein